MADKKQEGASRRDFLKLAGTAAPAAAALAVTTGEATAEDAPQGSGLKKTEHVEAYLASARF